MQEKAMKAKYTNFVLQTSSKQSKKLQETFAALDRQIAIAKTLDDLKVATVERNGNEFD